MVQLAVKGHPTRGSEVIKIDIPKDYEFTGVDNDNQQVVLTKIQPQYPKTYEECYKIVYPNSKDVKVTSVYGHCWHSLQKLSHLLICRDAYWKIAGKQMGLGEPWEVLRGENTYYIFNDFKNNKRSKCSGVLYQNVILTFPTKEMRDTFYDNFKDLIEECKEVL